MADKVSEWARMRDAWDRGDLAAVRDALDRMDASALEEMREELGETISGRLRRLRRRRRGPARGRVVVLNGIMGAHLYSVDRAGDADHVWIHLARLFFGQLARLELTPDGQQVMKRYRIEPRRLHKTYLPLAVGLESNWQVLQFPFDWRLDMDVEAGRLARTIEAWAGGEPVHLIAHSMGGVLARRFIAESPQLWQGMADPDGLRRGGRLVMLGTPNRGSFVIPAMLTGKEKLVKILSFIDFGESKRRFLRNASSFPGAYQMLPSPLVELQDDHDRLYEKATWGRFRVIERHLDMGRRFQIGLDAVVAPQRLVYVAGYGVATQQRIEVRRNGKFRYEISRDGDGRVPHSLGLLDQVATYWVQETHGDLPLNEAVLDGMDDLLELGRTPVLETTRSIVRRSDDAEWIDDDDLVTLSEEEKEAAKELGRQLRAVRSRGSSVLAPTRSARFMGDAMLDGYLASSEPLGSAERRPARTGQTVDRRRLDVEVFWGDIRRVRGNIYCVGHYEGVLPQRAEYALDTVVSRSQRLEEMVLRTHTQRGVLRGRLGDVNLYPWARTYSPPRTVAVAGMGYPGQFGEASLRTLARHLAWAVATLPEARTICTVLIGSGDGCLSIRRATRGMIDGMADALEAGLESRVERLRFVELYRDKALEIQEELRRIVASQDRVRLRLVPQVRSGRGGRQSTESSLALALAALVDAKTSRAKASTRATSTVLRRIPTADGMRDNARRALEGFAGPRATVAEIASRIRVELEPEEAARTMPARISFWRSEGATHIAALTNTAVMPERTSRVDAALLDELVTRLRDPESEEVTRFGSLLHRLIVPRDFHSVFEQAASLVVEVDRPMSTLNWELMTARPRSTAVRDCLGLRFPFARQLRTEYSPPPSGERGTAGNLRALVVGDPGDPAEGEHLPGAREEALRVAELLRRIGVDVTLRIGAAVRGRGPVSGVAPATLLDVLELLQTERFDILHYAGHGDFQDDEGLRSGWLFKDGMLTAAEVSTVETPPRLIVANACLSARTSTRLRGGERVAPEFGDAGLLPALADEFLRRGVRDYIGTAWEIDDEGAIRFATSLYEALKLDARSGAEPLGDAVLEARRRLAAASERYGALWAAYQHYGDPTLRLSKALSRRREQG